MSYIVMFWEYVIFIIKTWRKKLIVKIGVTYYIYLLVFPFTNNGMKQFPAMYNGGYCVLSDEKM
jgi:hypothetical protein